jgi:hypothetical protein
VSGGKEGQDGCGFVYGADFRISVYPFWESMKISVDLADWTGYLDVAVTKQTPDPPEIHRVRVHADSLFLKDGRIHNDCGASI